jgi:hypothetical protein
MVGDQVLIVNLELIKKTSWTILCMLGKCWDELSGWMVLPPPVMERRREMSFHSFHLVTIWSHILTNVHHIMFITHCELVFLKLHV